MKTFIDGYKTYRRIGHSRMRSLRLQIWDTQVMIKYFG